MGIRSRTDDVHRLSQEVNLIRHHIDEAMAELAKARERLPDAGQIEEQFSPAPAERRRDLAFSCTSLELALEDTKRWARDLVEKAQG